MGINTLISRLSGLKSSGQDRWIARCPAHADRTPSLAVRVLPEGRILLHCFGGCDTQAVLDAVGMKFSELFPEPLSRDGMPRIHAPFSALEALQCLARESAVVAICASDLARGRNVDHHRAAIAAGRIASALEAVHS